MIQINDVNDEQRSAYSSSPNLKTNGKASAKDWSWSDFQRCEIWWRTAELQNADEIAY